MLDRDFQDQVTPGWSTAPAFSWKIEGLSKCSMKGSDSTRSRLAIKKALAKRSVHVAGMDL